MTAVSHLLGAVCVRQDGVVVAGAAVDRHRMSVAAAGLRIEDVRAYDAYGNLVRQWKGDESPTGPNAVGLTRYIYPDPWNPTEKVVTDPLGVVTTTTWRRDPDSNIPWVTSSSGDCSSRWAW